MNTTKFNHPNKPLMVAHRGVSGLETENTCAAFVAAGNRSYYGIETDVHITADGRYVAFHDDETRRLAAEDMIIEQTDFATLRSLILRQRDGNFGRTDIRIPTMQEYIEICKQYEKHAFLEIKFDAAENEIVEICDTIKRFDYLDHVTFLGNTEPLIRLRKLYPEQSAQLLAWELTDEFLDTMVKYRLDFGVCHKKLTKEQLDLMHSKGIKVNVWVVNDVETAAKLADWGVDFISSNILE